MKILIAEDDYASRIYLSKILNIYGRCDLTIDGIEALDAYIMALEDNEPYNLICLDIMMPKVDGLKVFKAIREIEKEKKISEKDAVKIIIVTALNDKSFVFESLVTGNEEYISKPVDTQKFIAAMHSLKLIGE